MSVSTRSRVRRRLKEELLCTEEVYGGEGQYTEEKVAH
jgi:hypothetical protein